MSILSLPQPKQQQVQGQEGPGTSGAQGGAGEAELVPTGVEGGGEVGGGTGAPRCEGPSKGDWLPLEILG